MDEILKNAKSLPNSRLYVQAEAVQTVDTGYGGPLPPALMDQLAAAAAAQYVVPPGPQPTSAQQPPPPPPSQVQMPRNSGVIDAAVQTDVSTVVQSKQYLRRHVRIHTGERPYRCVVCQLSFRRSHHLRRHELMHTDIRPFSCHACDKAFKQKQHLERHLASHTGEKPFACHMCEKAFTRKQHLDRHIKMHTGRSLNFPMMNIDVPKSTVDGMTTTSPHSASSDSGSDTDDDQKPPVSDKPNSQVSKMVEGCRKRKTHSPVRLAPGEKKNRSSKMNAGSNTGTNTPSTSEASGQQTPNMANQRNFEYSIRNDIVFPRNEAVSAMAMREGGGGNGNQGGNMQAASTSTDGSMQTSHPLGSSSQTLEALQQQQQQQQQQQAAQHQQQFPMGGMNCLTSAQLQQLQQQMSGGKVDGSTQHQEGNNGAKTPQPLVVPSSHFSSTSKLPDIQGPKYTSAAAAIAGRQLQQAGVGVGVMEQPVHFKSVVGTQGAGGPHQAWSHALNWPPRLSLMADGSLQGMPTLTTYGTVNMADLNQVSGAAMYTAQKAMEMRMAAGLHRSPSIGTDTWVPVSGSDRDTQRGAPSANDRRIYSPQPNT